MTGAAVDEIVNFYACYHSQRFVEGDLILRLVQEPSDELVVELNQEFSDIITEQAFQFEVHAT